MVLCCNLRATEFTADAVAAVDRDVIVALARGGYLRDSRLVCGATVWKRLQAGGEIDRGFIGGTLLLDDVRSGYSSGIAAVEAAIDLGCRRIVLAGFDGTADRRTRYQGQPLYRSQPTRAVMFRGWERRLLEIAREHPDVEWLLHSDAAEHALDQLPARRIDLRALAAEPLAVESS